MKNIKVEDITNCTWKLEGDSFYCSHDETEIVTFYEDNFGIYEAKYQGYACAECGVTLDGDPEYDREDSIAESQLMNILGK